MTSSTTNVTQNGVNAKALKIPPLGGGKRLYVSRVNDANWAFPNLGQAASARVEFTLKRNFWSTNLHLAYDSDNDGKLSSEDRGFGLGSNIHHNQIVLFGANASEVASQEFTPSNPELCRYRIEINFDDYNGQGSGKVSVLDSDAASWTTLIEDINMGFDANASDKTNPGNLNGIWYYHEAGEDSRLDDITISIVPRTTATYNFEALTVDSPINGQDNWVVTGNGGIDKARVE